MSTTFEERFKCATPLNEQIKLSTYQKKVVEWLDTHRGLIAAFETGTGKTLAAIAVMTCFMAKNPGKPVVFVAPLSLLKNFTTQMKEKFGLNPESPEIKKVLTMYTFEKFNKIWMDSIDEKGNFQPNCNDGLLIVDEAHNLRTELTTKITKERDDKGNEKDVTTYQGIQALSVLYCANKASKVLLLTATPVYNNIYDINNLVAMIQGRLQPLKKDYFTKKTADETFFKDFFKCKIKFQSRNDADNYPRRVERIQYFEMDPEYYENYYKVQTEQKDKNLFIQFGNPQSYNKFYQGVRQAVNAIDREKSPKIKWVTEELQKNHQEGVKSIVYSFFLDSGIALIQNNLSNLNIPWKSVSGSIVERQRKAAVDQFNRGDVNVLFITQAGGEGLDLQGVEKVYILESGWNKQNDEQVIGRAVRRNSHVKLPPHRQQVEVVRLQMKKPSKRFEDDDIMESVDEGLYALAYTKKQPVLDQFIDRLKQVSIDNFTDCKQTEQDEIVDDIYYSARKSVFMVPLSEIIQKRDEMKKAGIDRKQKQQEKSGQARLLNKEIAELHEKFKHLDLDQRVKAIYEEYMKTHPGKNPLNLDEQGLLMEGSGERLIKKIVSNLITKKNVSKLRIYRTAKQQKAIEEAEKQIEQKRQEEKTKVVKEFNQQIDREESIKKIPKEIRLSLNEKIENIIMKEENFNFDSTGKEITDRLFELNKDWSSELFDPIYDYVQKWRAKVGSYLRKDREQRIKQREYQRLRDEEDRRKFEKEQERKKLKTKQRERLGDKKSLPKTLEEVPRKKITEIPRKKKKMDILFSKEFLQQLKKNIKETQKSDSDDEEPIRKRVVKERKYSDSDEEEEDITIARPSDSEDEEEEDITIARPSDSEDEEEEDITIARPSDSEDEEEDITIARPSDSEDEEEEPIRRRKRESEDSDDEFLREYRDDLTADEYQNMKNKYWTKQYEKDKSKRKRMARQWESTYEDVEEDVDVEPKGRKIKIGLCKADDVVLYLKFLFHFYITHEKNKEDTDEDINQKAKSFIRSQPEFAGCSEEVFKNLAKDAENEVLIMNGSNEITNIYKKALIKLFEWWREEKMVDVYDRVRDEETFTEMMSSIFEKDIIDDYEVMSELFGELQAYIMYCYILYDFLYEIEKENEILQEDDEYIFDKISNEKPSYNNAEDETKDLVKDLQRFFKSNKPKILSSIDFKRTLSYLHLVLGYNKPELMMRLLTTIFVNQDEYEMNNVVEKYFRNYEDAQKEECDRDVYIIAGNVLYVIIQQQLDSVEEESFIDTLKEVFADLNACTDSQLRKGIDLALEVMRMTKYKDFVKDKDNLLKVLDHSFMFDKDFVVISTLMELFQQIEKIFPLMDNKDLYKILSVVNEHFELAINEDFEIMLNQKSLISNRPYDQFLEKIYENKILEKSVKFENNIYYFTRDKEPSAFYIKTDKAGMYSVLLSQSIIELQEPCVYSYNEELNELRLTKEYDLLNGWIKFADLDAEYAPLYKQFVNALLVYLYEKKIYYNFQDILQSVYISSTKTSTYNFDLLGGQLNFNIAEILLLPTSWSPVIGKLITANNKVEEEIDIISVKKNLQIELFEDGKIKSEFADSIQFNFVSLTENDSIDFNKNLCSINKQESRNLCNLQESTAPYLYEPFCLENIPTNYFKVLIESVLFNASSPYHFSKISQGIYNRLDSYLSKGYCNLSNSHRTISALVSTDFINDAHLFDIQGYLLQLTERVKEKFSENKNKCETYGRYPATLSQIMAIKNLGGLQNLKNLVKKKFREIRDNDLDALLKLDDDLVIYNQMKQIYNKVSKKKEDPAEVDRYRANARLKELSDFLYDISKKYINKSNFVYLDYGGGEGGISKAIAERLRLKKENAFSLDVEDWYGNITEKRYQQYITYRTIKPFTALPFADDSVNLITSLQVLHHIPNLDYYMKELVRILKPGGYLVVREHDCNSELVRRLIDVEHMLFECVLNNSDKGNGRYLFEYKDSDNYKSINEWISYISNNGLELVSGYNELYKKVDQETRYVYRIFKKPEVFNFENSSEKLEVLGICTLDNEEDYNKLQSMIKKLHEENLIETKEINTCIVNPDDGVDKENLFSCKFKKIYGVDDISEIYDKKFDIIYLDSCPWNSYITVMTRKNIQLYLNNLSDKGYLILSIAISNIPENNMRDEQDKSIKEYFTEKFNKVGSYKSDKNYYIHVYKKK